MKGALLAAAVLLGSAQAGGVHKMKLKKVSLAEQLETVPLHHQMERLGQKYMGIRPDNHKDAMFQDTSVHVDGNHPVPVTNFMNAQCMIVPRHRTPNPFKCCSKR
jgi:saccharopepsin